MVGYYFVYQWLPEEATQYQLDKLDGTLVLRIPGLMPLMACKQSWTRADNECEIAALQFIEAIGLPIENLEYDHETERYQVLNKNLEIIAYWYVQYVEVKE
jgi:hypothetical protein